MVSKTIQQQLTSEEVLTTLLSYMPGYFYWKNTEGVYLGCNDYHAQRLGCQCGRDVLGKTDLQLLASHPRFSRYDTLVMSQGQTRIIDEDIISGGQVVNSLSLKSPILNKEQEVLGMLNLSLDIHREERLRLLNELDDEFTIDILPSLEAKRVLIVETEPTAKILHRVFERAGCQVDIVSDASSVIQQVNQEKYTLIFMDVRLTDDKGLNIAQQITTRSSKNQATPILGFNFY
ncbi:response regulator [Legionella fairfieldensis]|uniref:response regulator n=1 Tax=Legionella fairfieldensis TaxID=45064 RepID=UPI00048E1E3E|nr:response regulator [Legionella fairfieldensis]